MNPSVSSLSPLLESGDLNGEQLDTQNMLQQICSIVDIIDRDHMKVWTARPGPHEGMDCSEPIYNSLWTRCWLGANLLLYY